MTSKWETIKDTFSKARTGTELVQWEMGNQSLSWLFESVSPSHQNPVVLAEVCGLLPCQTRGAASGGAGGRGGWLVAGGWCSGRGGSAGGPGGHLCSPAPAVSLCHLGFCVCACWHGDVSCPAAEELLGSVMGDGAGKICGKTKGQQSPDSPSMSRLWLPRLDVSWGKPPAFSLLMPRSRWSVLGGTSEPWPPPMSSPQHEAWGSPTPAVQWHLGTPAGSWPCAQGAPNSRILSGYSG